MGKADDEIVVGGKWSWSTFAHPSFVIQRYKDVVQNSVEGSLAIDFEFESPVLFSNYVASVDCLVHVKYVKE